MSDEETADEHDGAAVHGDILESILSHVPFVDLALSSCVSRGWNLLFIPLSPIPTSPNHGSSSIQAPDPNPLLSSLLTTLAPPYGWTSTTALQSPPPIIALDSTLHTHTLQLLFLHRPPPPHVASRGSPADVAGRSNCCPCRQQSYRRRQHMRLRGRTPGRGNIRLESKAWDACNELHSIFAEYTTATWFSIAIDDDKLHVMHRNSGAIPINKSWAGPYDLKPDSVVFSSIIGFAGGKMGVVGLFLSPEDVKSLKIYEVVDQFSEWREIGEMPNSLVKKLQGESAEMTSIDMLSAGDFIFLHHRSDPVEVIQCEVVGGGCRWGQVPNTVVDDRTRLRRLVFTCSNISIGDLQRALRSESQRISIKVRDSNGLN